MTIKVSDNFYTPEFMRGFKAYFPEIKIVAIRRKTKLNQFKKNKI